MNVEPLSFKTQLDSNESGFTLIEIIAVVLILALISGVVAFRFGGLQISRARSELFKLTATLDEATNNSNSNGVSYKAVFNLDENYLDFFEELVNPEPSTQVDLLSGLRIRPKREDYNKRTTEAQNIPILTEYTHRRFGQASESFKPVGSRMYFKEGVKITEILQFQEHFDSGEVIFRIAPNGSSDFIAIYLDMLGISYTLVLNPASNFFELVKGHKDFNWGS